MSNTAYNPFVKNWQILLWFVIAIFTAGGLFAEFTSLKTELTMVHERLDNKVDVINRLEDRIISIEKQLEYERGLLEATIK
jgi:CII-binding regulator of phage lambda lysogenization HflD|tara:strand:- start:285 stop:527 length:243 start_codon:yes stop_codon:yes gene_type:complete